MSFYSIALFLHVVGALFLFVSLTDEGVALRQLHGKAPMGRAIGAATLLRLNQVVGPLSALGVLIPGLYMTATSWGVVPWIGVALLSWVLVAIFGTVNAVRIVALEQSQAF